MTKLAGYVLFLWGILLLAYLGYAFLSTGSAVAGGAAGTYTGWFFAILLIFIGASLARRK